MGLFDRIKDAMEGDEEAPEWTSVSNADEGSDENRPAEQEPESHADVIAAYYESVLDDQASRIADVLEEHLSSPGGYSLDQVIEEIEGETGLPGEAVERIVRTEIASFENLETVRKFESRPVADDDVFKWSGPTRGECHPICETVRADLDARGGTVAMDELQRLLRETARNYEAEGGTPERMDHWVPHEACRCRINRHIEL